MNVLAEKQKYMNEDGITQAEYEKRKEEFLKLYYELRRKDEKKWWSKLSLKQRQAIHKYILAIYKIKNKIGGFDCELIKDEREKTDRPIIFAITHVGKFDIEVVSEAIKDHYYLLSGDYEHLQGIIDAPFLGLNGVFYFNENVKEDRRQVSQSMINHLKEGGNLMYFPEGTWNITEELPVLPCYWGIVDIAQQSNAIVIPVAAEQYGKTFKVNIGKNIDMNAYDKDIEGKTEAINNLRDILATLKWEIWETEEMQTRRDLNEQEWEKYKEDRFSEWPYFNEEYIEGLIFKPKDIVSNEEVFEKVRKLTPHKQNAFLFNKRATGIKK